MIKNSILKISSSNSNGLGTGFVIDKDENGVFVATCGHVINTCGEDILLDEQKASLVKNYYDEGLDIAILYLKGVELEPLTLEYNTEAKKVKVQGYTYFGADVKKETMSDIDAKYKIELEKEQRSIEIVRLTPKEKITSGYSGSPVICEETGVVVGMVIVEAREQHTNYAISVKHILEAYSFPKEMFKSWIWTSSVASTDRLQFSILALVETLVAVGVSFLIWFYSESYWHIITGVMVAPLFLLRTEESEKHALFKFKEIEKKMSSSINNIDNKIIESEIEGIVLLIVVLIGSFIFIGFFVSGIINLINIFFNLINNFFKSIYLIGIITSFLSPIMGFLKDLPIGIFYIFILMLR